MSVIFEGVASTLHLFVDSHELDGQLELGQTRPILETSLEPFHLVFMQLSLINPPDFLAGQRTIDHQHPCDKHLRPILMIFSILVFATGCLLAYCGGD